MITRIIQSKDGIVRDVVSVSFLLVDQNAVKRGVVTKKKNRLKKLDLESSQQTISHVEKAEEVDEEARRREREEDRRRWLQQQRIKYPVAPDGKSSIHRSIHRFIHPSIRPSVHPFIRPSVHPSIRPSVHPFI